MLVTPKLCMGEQTLLGKFMGGCFTLGLMIRSCKGRCWWFRGFKGRVKLVFLLLTLTWVIHILFEKLTPLIRIEFEKHILYTMSLGLGVSCNDCLLFLKIFSGDMFFDVLIIEPLEIYVFMGLIHGEVI